MKIKEISLWDFGKFKEAVFRFGDRFNCIYGPNEAGKSTLFHSIELGFYGSGSRKNDPRINVRQRYISGSEDRSRILIIFKYGDRDYSLDRDLGSSPGKDRLEIRDNLTGREINLPMGQSPGQYFFNMDQDAFKISFLIGAGGSQMGSKEGLGLSERLANLYESGNEDLSLNEFIDRVNKEKKFYRSLRGRTGFLDKLEDDILDLRRKMDLSLEKEKEKFLEEQELDGLIKKGKDLVNNRKLAREKEDRDLEKEIQNIENKNQLIDESLKSFEEDRNRVREEIHGLELEEAKLQAGQDGTFFNKEEISELKHAYDELGRQIAEKKGSASDIKIYIGLFLIGLIFFGAAYLLKNLSLYLIMAGLVCLIPCLAYGLKKNNEDKARTLYLERLEGERDAVRMKLLYAKGFNFKNQDGKLEEIGEKRRVLEKNLLRIEEKIANARAMGEKNREAFKILNDRRINNREPEEIEESLKELDKEIEEKRREILLKYASYENAESLASQIRNLEEEKARSMKEYKALELIIESANKNIKSRENSYLPDLNRKATEIMREIVGKDDKVLRSDTTFNLSLEDRVDNKVREWRALSSGTIRQAYLSLRLAIIELLSDGETLPIFMDDAMVYYDDERAGRAAKFLKNLSEREDRQVIYFTGRRSFLNEFSGGKSSKLLIINETGFEKLQ